jgi:tetratricopeptide (TPR) repeat protein
MAAERKFAQGSIIYFDHEKSDSIFILKAGRVDLSYIQPETGEKITKEISQGEFFGLKSAIINHTRDEVAEAVTDAVTIEFKIPDFESYVSKNVELMKRLLRVLSNQLRNLGIKVNNYLGNNVLNPPNIGIFKIGEYYLNNKQYKQAMQVYQRYIEQYPETNIVQEAKYRISISEEAIKTGFLKEFRPIDSLIGGGETPTATTAPVADAKDSMENAHSALGVRGFMDKYYKAQSFVTGQDYSSAEKYFTDMFSMDLSSVNQDMIGKAKLMQMETLCKLKKYNECSQLATDYIKITKDPRLVKQTLFIMADMYHELNNLEGEKSIIQKVLVMTPVDDLTKLARDRMSKIK